MEAMEEEDTEMSAAVANPPTLEGGRPTRETERGTDREREREPKFQGHDIMQRQITQKRHQTELYSFYWSVIANIL